MKKSTIISSILLGTLLPNFAFASDAYGGITRMDKIVFNIVLTVILVVLFNVMLKVKNTFLLILLMTINMSLFLYLFFTIL